ncbi:hypothetical protein HWV62_4541 [Athelia sp. TMB]|nr:hypothetical protein HWV62_4541 [Athelia sp. TMB]
MSFTSKAIAYPHAELFSGLVETTLEALYLVEAARQGKITRIVRRLSTSERQAMIKSGAVFTFSVEESGIKRWTDGRLWSPSRIDGNFLVYTEMLERTPRPSQKKDIDLKPAFTREETNEAHLSLTASSPLNVVKAGGLLKKTVTVTTDDGDQHIVSYYTPADAQPGRLSTVTMETKISSIELDPSRFVFSRFRYPPTIVLNDRGFIRTM